MNTPKSLSVAAALHRGGSEALDHAQPDAQELMAAANVAASLEASF